MMSPDSRDHHHAVQKFRALLDSIDIVTSGNCLETSGLWHEKLRVQYSFRHQLGELFLNLTRNPDVSCEFKTKEEAKIFWDFYSLIIKPCCFACIRTCSFITKSESGRNMWGVKMFVLWKSRVRHLSSLWNGTWSNQMKTDSIGEFGNRWTAMKCAMIVGLFFSRSYVYKG